MAFVQNSRFIVVVVVEAVLVVEVDVDVEVDVEVEVDVVSIVEVVIMEVVESSSSSIGVVMHPRAKSTKPKTRNNDHMGFSWPNETKYRRPHEEAAESVVYGPSRISTSRRVFGERLHGRETASH